MSLSGNPLGSVSALSLAANPAALPMVAIAAGAGVTIAAATFCLIMPTKNMKIRKA